MSLWHIAWSYLWNRRFTTAMTIVSVGLGVALISTVLTLRDETRKRFEEEGQSFDIVVGAKGNPLQLVLSSVYYMDMPTGNIPYHVYERLLKEDDVATAFPIGLGDSYRGFRLVGTSADLFAFADYGVSQGRLFDKPFEAVLGWQAAAETGLRIGDRFVSTHGLVAMGPTHEHKHNPYTVVGILDRSGSPSDRAIFCSLESVWKAHEHHDEDGEHGDEEGDHEDHQQVAMHDESGDHEGHEHGQHELETTAVLVKLHSPALRRAFKDRVNEQYNAMAAVPVNEIRKLYDQFLGTVKAVLLAIGYLVVVISSISILIGLYMSILQRKRDLAVMRALGASRGEIFGSVLIEGFWVSVLGLGVGWLFGTVTCALLGRYLVAKVGFQISSVSFTPDLVTAYSFVVLMGIVAGLLPAWQAYRSNVARDLAEL